MNVIKTIGTSYLSVQILANIAYIIYSLHTLIKTKDVCDYCYDFWPFILSNTIINALSIITLIITIISLNAANEFIKKIKFISLFIHVVVSLVLLGVAGILFISTSHYCYALYRELYIDLLVILSVTYFYLIGLIVTNTFLIFSFAIFMNKVKSDKIELNDTNLKDQTDQSEEYENLD